MEQSNFSRFILAADLFICTIWLLLVVHVGSTWHSPLLWTIPVFRIWLSFLTYRRSRMALMPLTLLAVFYVATLQRHASPVFLLFNRPALSLIKSVSAMFCPGGLTPDEFSALWHGSLDYKYMIMAIASIWVVVIPAVVYVYRLIKKQLVPSQFGIWKRVGLFAYIAFGLIVMSVFFEGLGWSSISVSVLCLFMMLIPVVFNHGKLSGLLSRTEQVFVVGLALLGVTYSCALSYNPLSSVMTLVVPAAIYTLVNWHLDRRVEYADVLLLVTGSVFFSIGQYVTGMFRIVLLLLSLGLFTVAIIRFAYSTKKFWQSIILYLIVGVFVPIFSIGYNPYAVWEARKCMHYDDYDFSRNGLMLIKGKDGFGIRDRYGVILPPEYESVEHLESSKPYCKVLNDELWMVYDIERHKFISDEKFTDVTPYDRYTYRLVSADGSVKYLIMPIRYSRYSYGKEAQIVDQLPSEEEI